MHVSVAQASAPVLLLLSAGAVELSPGGIVELSPEVIVPDALEVSLALLAVVDVDMHPGVVHVVSLPSPLESPESSSPPHAVTSARRMCCVPGPRLIAG